MLTLRQLCWMADAVSRDRWNHTASLMALISNCHRDPKKSRAARPKDFHPHTQPKSNRSSDPKPRVGVEVLKQVFVDRRPLDAQ
ncbi:hypothetical protein [Thalassoglobus sp.]|uniref:hypothetical protein n=1 Tax=Thalassoglobus sp. TaxID=2795869 RepID=UPI003AA8E78D